jgi:hypothetical protein
MKTKEEIEDMRSFIGYFNDGQFMNQDYRWGLIAALDWVLYDHELLDKVKKDLWGSRQGNQSKAWDLIQTNPYGFAYCKRCGKMFDGLLDEHDREGTELRLCDDCLAKKREEDKGEDTQKCEGCGKLFNIYDEGSTDRPELCDDCWKKKKDDAE